MNTAAMPGKTCKHNVLNIFGKQRIVGNLSLVYKSHVVNFKNVYFFHEVVLNF